MSKNPWEFNKDNEGEEDLRSSAPETRATPEERKLAAEIVVYIEHELSINVKRLRVVAREGSIYVQGNVSTPEERQAIIKDIPMRPKVRSFNSNISINDQD